MKYCSNRSIILKKFFYMKTSWPEKRVCVGYLKMSTLDIYDKCNKIQQNRALLKNNSFT